MKDGLVVSKNPKGLVWKIVNFTREYGLISKENTNDLIVTLTAIGPLFAIYLYFLGVSYEYALFYYLGFSLGSVEIPINDTLVYSYGALLHCSFWNLALWILLAVAILVLLFGDRSRHLVKVVFLIVAVLLFPVSSGVASSYAHQQAVRLTWYPEKMVFFTFKDKTTMPIGLQTANDSDGLILILQTADKVVAMDRIADQAHPSAQNYLYVLELSDLSSMRIRFQGVNDK